MSSKPVTTDHLHRIPHFLSLDEILFLHRVEVATSGGTPALRDLGELESALGAPQASFGGVYLMTIFEMASSYIYSIAYHHPFLDGNKRTALLSALTFLFFNGYEVDEIYEEEFADWVLGLLTHKYTKEDLTQFVTERAHKRK